MAQQNSNKPRTNSTVYTNSHFSSYDSTFSSLSWTWANDNAILTVAPIEPNMIGKTPKRGEKVYDYDNKLSIFISPTMANGLIKAINDLREVVDSAESEEDIMFDRITVDEGSGDSYRSFTVIRPNGIALKVRGKATRFEGYLLQGVVKKAEEDEERFFHLFSSSSIKYIKKTASDNEETEVVHESTLEVFIAFLQAVIDNAVALSAHTAQRVLRNMNNAGGAGGAKNGKRKFGNMVEEYDEEESDDEPVDEEEDDQPAPRKSSKKSAPTKRSNARKAALSEEFGDEEFEDDIPM